MSHSIVRQLILSDLYLQRWMVLGAIAVGIGSVALMPLMSMWTYVGGVLVICVLIVLNIFLVMTSIVQEKKDKVQLFMLSLPISPLQYTAAKIVSNAIAFIVPWLVLSAAVLMTIDVTPLPNGILPFWSVLLTYLLLYFCVLLAIAVVSDSTGVHATAITLGNVSVNFLIAFLLAAPSVVAHRDGPAAVWTTDMISILAIELTVAVAAIGAALFLRSRTVDFV
jgi:ABC-2 type transport system permease protein